MPIAWGRHAGSECSGRARSSFWCIEAEAVAPGDRIERTIVLAVRGHGRLGIVGLTVKAQRESPLTDRAQGLRLSLERYSRPWLRVGASSYTCRGQRKTLLIHVPVLGMRRLQGLMVWRGSKAQLRLTLNLPGRAGNASQGRAATFVYRFTGVAQE